MKTFDDFFRKVIITCYNSNVERGVVMPITTLERKKVAASSKRHALVCGDTQPRKKKLNKATLDAIHEVDGDGGKVFNNSDELFKDLGI